MTKSIWIENCQKYNSISAKSHKQGKVPKHSFLITTTESLKVPATPGALLIFGLLVGKNNFCKEFLHDVKREQKGLAIA